MLRIVYQIPRLSVYHPPPPPCVLLSHTPSPVYQPPPLTFTRQLLTHLPLTPCSTPHMFNSPYVKTPFNTPCQRGKCVSRYVWVRGLRVFNVVHTLYTSGYT